MKAVQINAYGSTEVLEIQTTVPNPTLSAGHVLVENYAASINPFDWKLRSGMLQKIMPIAFPAILGGDFAGIVRKVGEGVSDYAIGDEVYGQALILGKGSGSFAEYVAAPATHIARKPVNISFVEAGALPLAGSSAIQAVEEHILLHSGQKILIHGGAGGIGSLAIQIAKALGAYVVTTVSSQEKDFVQQLGADEVIEYKTQRFEERVKDIDAVYDTVGGETTERSFGVLKKGGVLVSMLGQPNPELAQKYAVTAIGQNTHVTTAHLQRLAGFVEAGKVKVRIAKIFPLDQIKEAFSYQEQSHPQGKVVLQIR